MQQALGLMGDQALMFFITVAMGIGGIAALLVAVLWPGRWRLKYRMEVGFVLVLVGLVAYADTVSTRTFKAYEKDLSNSAALSGKRLTGTGAQAFDRHVKVYAFQWGFVFLDEQGRASRNAVRVEPGERVAFSIMSNDVMHGFNIPVARMTTEIEPGAVGQVWIEAPAEPGKYLIQCLNYCGLGHAQMKAWLVVGSGEKDRA